MSKTTLTYQIEGTLKNGLQIASEIENEMGMIPVSIETEKESLNYDQVDSNQVRFGFMTEEEYVKKHKN